MKTTNIPIRVQARAHRNQIMGMRRGVLHILVTATPEKGRANEAVIQLLSAHLGVSKGRITFLRGLKNREKLLSIMGLTADDVGGS